MKRSIKYGLISILIIIGILIGYYLTSVLYPKNLNRYPLFLLLIAMDVFLHFQLHKSKKSINPVWYWITLIGIWLPSVLLSGALIVEYFYSADLWNEAVRIYLFGFVFSLYVSQFFPTIILLIKKLIDVICSIFRRTKRKAERGWAYTLSIMGLAIFLLMCVGMFQGAYRFDVRKETIVLNDLPQAFDNYKIVQITDLHLGSWAKSEKLEEAVQIINDLKPDIIVFTGDLVNFQTQEAFRFKDILSRMNAKDGVYAILGNHDYGDYVNWDNPKEKQENMRQLEDFYKCIGWTLLKNEHKVFVRGTDSIALIGVENWGANSRFPQLGDTKKASEGIEQLPTQILLSHDPSHWTHKITKDYPEIDLTLSGHTHGFQFGIKLGNYQWSPAQYFYPTWAGLYRENTQYLYVSRGLGSLSYPGRIGIFPEITLITLKSANNQN